MEHDAERDQKGRVDTGTGGNASASANGGAATSGPAVVNNSAWVDQRVTLKAKIKIACRRRTKKEATMTSNSGRGADLPGLPVPGSVGAVPDACRLKVLRRLNGAARSLPKSDSLRGPRFPGSAGSLATCLEVREQLVHRGTFLATPRRRVRR